MKPVQLPKTSRFDKDEGIVGSNCPPIASLHMSTENDLTPLTDEALKRIGRNLVNFQKIERMLKFLIANGKINGPIKELTALHEKRHSETRRTTMGLLAGRFVDEILTDAGDLDNEVAEITEPWFRHKIRFEQDPQESEQLRDGLRSLVEQRNELVHHLFPAWDTDSIQAARELIQRLDEQREQLIPVFDRLRGMCASLSEGMKGLSEFFESREGKLTLEHLWLCQSPVVEVLTHCAEHSSRPDGWAPLATAGRFLWQTQPEHAASLKRMYGYSSLKQLALATEMFDIWDEPTEKGFRTMFRTK